MSKMPKIQIPETFARIHLILKVSGFRCQVKALSVQAESSKLIADSQKK
jgi:hypothetical protein